MVQVALVVLAVAGPLVYLLGLLSRGLAVLYLDYARLAVLLVTVSMGAGASVYLAVRDVERWVRIASVVALLANLGGVGYGWVLWSEEMGRTRAEDVAAPVEAPLVGVVLAPLDDSPAAAAELQAVESVIVDILRRNEALGDLALRRSQAVRDEEQARRVATELNAHVIAWSAAGRGYPPLVQWHVTVMGASEAVRGLTPSELMVLMATQQRFTVSAPLGDGEVSEHATKVVAPVAAGFAAMAMGRPVVAATQFRNAAQVEGLPDATRSLLLGYRATALLQAHRADLAMEELERARSIHESAYVWASIGTIMVVEDAWTAAHEAFQRAVALDPYDALGYCGLGLALAHDNEAASAIAAYRQAAALEPGWPTPHALLGMAYELLGESETAAEEYAQCVAKAGANRSLRQAVARRVELVAQNPPTAVPTNTPRPTATPTPVPSSGVYQVKKGDTLQAIAIEFDVPLDLLIEVNRIENPHDLQIGQIIIIPELP